MKMFKQETQFCILLNPLFPGRKGEGLKFTDEPTGNLDTHTSLEVMQLLKMTTTEFGQTLVMITHNPELAQVADRMLHIEDGKIAE